MIPDGQFKINVHRNIAGVLNDKGIYDIVSEEDIRSVMGITDRCGLGVAEE
jgi:hypothetical protein